MRKKVSEILEEVAFDHDLTTVDLVDKCRKRYVSWPRQEAYFRVFTECPHISYPDMSRRIGNRDHTTALHGVRAHCKRIGITYDDAKLMREVAAGAARVALPSRYTLMTVLAGQFAQAMEDARA